MTYIGADTPLFKLKKYVAGVYPPIMQTKGVTTAIRSFYEWTFQFLRNALICGILRYFADATESTMLKILAVVAFVALALDCGSYIHMRILTPFHCVKHERLGVWLDRLVTATVLGLLLVAIWSVTGYAINEIAKGHAASHSVHTGGC